MHNDIHYNLDNQEAAEAAAMEDIKVWLVGRFDHISSLLKAEIASGCTLEQFELMVSFAGIQGYPVKIWFKQLGGTQA